MTKKRNRSDGEPEGRESSGDVGPALSSRIKILEGRLARITRTLRRTAMGGVFLLGLGIGTGTGILVDQDREPVVLQSESVLIQGAVNSPFSFESLKSPEIDTFLEIGDALEELEHLNELDVSAQLEVIERLENAVEAVLEAEARGELEPDSETKNYLLGALKFAAGVAAAEVIKAPLKRLLRRLEGKPNQAWEWLRSPSASLHGWDWAVS